MSEIFDQQGLPKPESKTSPRERYKSSPQEVVLESRDFESEGDLLGGIIGSARFVKIRDDGGAFLSRIRVIKVKQKPLLFREKEPLI